MPDRNLNGLKAYRRRFGWHIQPAFKKYTSLVGEVIWASNDLHTHLLLLFKMVFPADEKREERFISLNLNEDMAAEIWHSLTTDAAQRTILGAIVKHSKFLSQQHRNSILWVIEAAGNLSRFRNDAVHTAFQLDWDELKNPKLAKFIPSSEGLPKRIEKLERVGHTKLFKTLVGDLNQLSGYTAALWLCALYSDGKTPPLPKRPILKSMLLVQKTPPKPIPPKQRGTKRFLTIKSRNKRTPPGPEDAVPQTFGYVGVSVSTKEFELEGVAISKARCHEIFAEEINHKGLPRPLRPQYNLMRKQIQRGDKLVIYAFDRLAKNKEDVLNIADELKAEGVRIRSITEPSIRPETKKGRLALSQL